VLVLVNDAKDNYEFAKKTQSSNEIAIKFINAQALLINYPS
jgi:hypothetical protein